MSLLRDAERCLERQSLHRALNAFITPIKDHRSFLQHASKELDARAQDSTSPIAGKVVAVKDNIVTTEWPTTCASNILQDYVSPFDATVIKKLRVAGALIAGKTNLDEFGMGSHSIYSSFGPVRNACDVGEDATSVGGSSGGSALAVATGQCHAALGTDTGGSVRLPAAYTGVVGFKPSYGLLSRHGVVAYANSLDTVGVLSPTVSLARSIFSALSAFDSSDPTSLSPPTRSRLPSSITSRHPTLRIGIPTDYNIAELSPQIRATWLQTLHGLRSITKNACTLHSVSLPTTPAALPAYYILAPAEASSNLARYDTVRYGAPRSTNQDDTEGGTLYAASRGRLFGPEVQRRILLGAYSLSAAARDNYFVQAQKVRRLVQRDFDNVFAMPNPLIDVEQTNDAPAEGVDVLITPTTPTLAPRLEDVRKMGPVEAYMNDVFTVPASLAGLPAISVPVSVEDAHGASAAQETGGKVGIQVIGQFGDDELVLHVAEMIEQLGTSDK
ncbi:MAG: Trimeric GatFAB AmidoTransferase(AdT) complex subunit [Piccolia ochrophora]|nr:MAG: Trimeric GatFAB AmidoTransferase(AdT) complex subunit [Piccolia ochrophora]